MDLKESAIAKKNHRHPWELARTYFLINKIIPHNTMKLLDVGSGDLFLLNSYLKTNPCSITAIDKNFPELDRSNANIEMLYDFESLKKNYYDTITLFDVLEHVDNDQLLICDLKTYLIKHGDLIISVPAYQYLFSKHDQFLGHHRRYSKKDLTSKIKNNNLEIKQVFNFFFTLYIVRCFQKFFTNQLDRPAQTGLANWNYSESHIITRLIFSFLVLDCFICYYFSKLKIKLPGLSICLIAKKVKS